MAVEEILIKFVADTAGLSSAKKAQDDLKASVDKTGKSYNDLEKEIREGINDELKAANVTMKQFGDAVIKAAKTGTDSFKSLRQQLKEAREEAARVAEQFGEGSAQFQEAARRAGELKAKVGDLNDTLSALDPDAKSKAFTQFGNAAFGAFQIATGALQTFGIENERVAKLAQQFQGAINLSQGISQLGQLSDSFKNIRTVLGFTTVAQQGLNAAQAAGTTTTAAYTAATETQTVVTTGAAVATRGLGAAMTALPIVALITLVGGLVATFVDLADAADDAAENAKKFADETAKGVRDAASNLQRATREYEIATGKITETQAAVLALQEEFAKANQGEFFNLKKTRDEIAATQASIASLRERIASLEAGNQTEATAAIIAEQKKRLASQIALLDQQKAAEANLNKIIKDNTAALTKDVQTIREKARQEDLAKEKKNNEDKSKNEIASVEKTMQEVKKLREVIPAPTIDPFENINNEVLKGVDVVASGVKATFSDTAEEVEATWQEKFFAITSAASDFFNALVELQQQATQFEIDSLTESEEIQTEQLRKQLDERVISKAQYEKRVQALNDQTDQKVKKLQSEQAERNKRLAIFNATTGAAQAIINIFATPGLDPITRAVLVGLTAAATAAQIATIVATPVPKFAKGTLSVQGGKEGQDSVAAVLMPGEAVIPTKTNRKYKTAVKAIYEETVQADELHKFVTMTPAQRQMLLLNAGQQFNVAMQPKDFRSELSKISVKEINSFAERSVTQSQKVIYEKAGKVDAKELAKALVDSGAFDNVDLYRAIRKQKELSLNNADEIAYKLGQVINSNYNPRA